MSVRLAAAAREARANTGIKLIDIASEASVSESVVSRFETSARGHYWPERTDEIIAAYERVLGLPRDELWRRALENSA